MKWNVRVYGLVIENGNLLLLDEMYAGERLLKLPGGGVEFGEGLPACLCREFQEELGVEVSDLKHFYTQEDFVRSRFNPNEALLSIYYTCSIPDSKKIQILDSSISGIIWHPISSENVLQLPVDRIVFEKLKAVIGT